ncbi:MAG: hypothetical protein IH820_11035, partial [Bacteroidetes bacterium]|nr:hypothetical protein [Bacteroidota bacterium]
DGYDEATADRAGRQVGEERMRSVQAVEQVNLRAQVSDVKRKAANHYAQEYGVDANELVDFDSQDQMERHARVLKRINTNDARISTVEKTRVPVQTFDDGPSSGGGMNPVQLLNYYGNHPEVEMSEAHKRSLIDAGYGA